ncbi:class A beta-lactamase [uncultured Ramlibacter sp.]|uniref:class A beta-lactamase n=1 Tax=uncultured Ramlibacter sp. TaxID=260755 RepID=UPI0026081074|nr:class A beta-lactamase [uncultured Ramlibacter sp.]
MNRRSLMQTIVYAIAAGSPLAGLAQQKNWQAIEAGVGGRLGVAVLDTATGRLEGHKLDERFPMCSTFKWLAAAHVLQRVDQGQERLDRRIRYGREVLLPHSPITEKHVDEGMSLAGLCEATVTISDNAAGNLILQSLGGPEGLTRYARSLGDTVTRLDRTEPTLNEARPGDPRDTTSPRAMVQLLRATMVGDALSPTSRAQLVQWMEATSTNGARLKAGLPAGWRLGSKTGTGGRGSTNDVGVYWPPGRAPIVVAVYLTQCEAPAAAREAAIAAVARTVFGG